MDALLGPLVVSLLLVNLVALASARINLVVRAVALQGLLLGALALVAHTRLDARAVALALATAVLKGWLIPAILGRALRQVAIKREEEPSIGLLPSLLLGALAAALALAFGSELPFAEARLSPLLIPTALATAVTGLIVLTTRRKAISQVLGYLILENGIFIFGLLLVEAMPFLVEAGVLLDVFVGIFVSSIIIHHINQEFSSLDTRRLSLLKEEQPPP